MKGWTRAVKDAAKAEAELYVFAAVEEILTGSTAPRSATGQKAADRIVKICSTEQKRRLKEYDAALSRATGAATKGEEE